MKRLSLIVAGAALALVGCASEPSAFIGQGSATNPGLLVLPAGMRPPAPDLRGTTLDGKELDLASLRGDIVLLNAFASWCPPCQAELPVLAAADRELQGVQVVGLDVLDQDEAAIGTLDAAGASFPAIRDPRGTLMAAFTGEPTRGLPFTILIDGQGRVAGRIIGPATTPMLTEAVQRINARTGADGTS